MDIDFGKLFEMDRLGEVAKVLMMCEHAVTEIDLILHDWQEATDMMSFIGSNASFALWTNDIPPRLVTKDVLAQAAGKELRVMHHIDGEWTKIGTAQVDGDGKITATIEKDIPELRVGMFNRFSVGHRGEWKPLPSERAFESEGPLAHFVVDKDGSWKQNAILPGFPVENVPADVPKIRNDWDIDNNVPEWYHNQPKAVITFLDEVDDETYWKYLNMPADEFEKLFRIHRNNIRKNEEEN